MKKKACAILVGTVLICQTASVYGAVQDYQAVTKADKEDNKTIQTFQTEDGDGNAVTVAAVNDILYVTAKDAGIYSKPGEDTEKLADVSLGDELSRSAVCDNGWSKVSCEVDGNQIIGYIQNQMLSDTDQIEPANEEVEVKSDATVLDYPGRKDGEEIGEVRRIIRSEYLGSRRRQFPALPRFARQLPLPLDGDGRHAADLGRRRRGGRRLHVCLGRPPAVLV